MNEQPIVTKLAGISNLSGDRIDQYPVRSRRDMRVFITNITYDGGKREASLIVGRKTGMGDGRSVIIPLSSAWQYDMPDMVAEKVALVSKALFDQPTLSEAHVVMDTILTHLPKLYSWSPERIKTPAEIEAEAHRYRLKVQDGNGNTLIDCT